jgi:uncharacterized FlgJ-related protein
MFRNLTTRIRKHRARIAQERAFLTYAADCYDREIGSKSSAQVQL